MRPPARWPVAAGLLAGCAADLALGDPPRLHPVAGLGWCADRLEAGCYRPTRRAGALYTVVLASGATGLAWAVDRAVLHQPAARVGLTAVLTWAALGGRSLHDHARRVAADLDGGDLPAARRRLPALVARDPAGLDGKAVARAAVESVAENTSDAVVGPLLWGGLAGPAGIVLHRTANTLDAMVGYRDRRYRRFGWAAARLDDTLNHLPARATAGLAGLLAPTVGGTAGQSRATVRRDAPGHPSGNAGRVEAAFAGVLGVRLGGGVNRYGEVVEARPPLGEGPPPVPGDIGRAVALSRAVGWAALAAGAALALLWGGR